MNEFSRLALPLELSSLNSVLLTGSFQALNATPFPGNAFWIRIVNANTTGITISYDGVTEHEFIPGTAVDIPRESLTISFTATPAQSGLLYLRKGTTVYVKGDAGSGIIYMSGFYQEN